MFVALPSHHHHIGELGGFRHHRFSARLLRSVEKQSHLLKFHQRTCGPLACLPAEWTCNPPRPVSVTALLVTFSICSCYTLASFRSHLHHTTAVSHSFVLRHNRLPTPATQITMELAIDDEWLAQHVLHCSEFAPASCFHFSTALRIL